MSSRKVDFIPNLTFVTVTRGPTLDNISAKTIRAHTTRANFARRRLRLVQEYAAKKAHAALVDPRHLEEDSHSRDRDRRVDIETPISIHLGLERKLSENDDAFFINHLTQAMQKLHLVSNIPALDTASAVMQSDWARFLPDPTMNDVSVYFARHVYVARLQTHAAEFVVDAYKGRAIRSVRERLDDGSNNLSDSLIAAILILTVINQVLGNIESWKIHISGLVRIITLRSRNSIDPPTFWISHTIPRTIFQGLLLFTRHDAKLLRTIEKTDIFDTMFSIPAKGAVYLILASVEQVAMYNFTSFQNKKPHFDEQTSLRRITKSLDTAIQLNRTGCSGEAFLTAIALSIKIFLELVLRWTMNAEGDFEHTTVQLMDVLQEPEQRLCSSLALCSSLESLFWQSMLGAIAAPDARTKSFYTSRLGRITTALALTSWQDASNILQKFFWIPNIFATLGYQIFSEIQYLQGSSTL